MLLYVEYIESPRGKQDATKDSNDYGSCSIWDNQLTH